MEATNKFTTAYTLDVNSKVEKKAGMSYLSWAFAWAEFCKIYENATYEVLKNDKGMPYFADENGAFCYTKITADGKTHEMWLPVMDNRNKSIVKPSSFDVNKTIMRCLVKNMAMFGLGLYIYAGEDLPEEDTAKMEEERKTAMDVFLDKMKEAGKPITETTREWLKKQNITTLEAHIRKLQDEINRKLVEGAKADVGE